MLINANDYCEFQLTSGKWETVFLKPKYNSNQPPEASTANSQNIMYIKYL